MVAFALRLVTLLPLFVIIATSILGFHPEAGGVFVTEFVLFLTLFVSRHFVIALKYGKYVHDLQSAMRVAFATARCVCV